MAARRTTPVSHALVEAAIVVGSIIAAFIWPEHSGKIIPTLMASVFLGHILPWVVGPDEPREGTGPPETLGPPD